MEMTEFYKKNFLKVTASVFKIIGNWSDAEDITQDVFIRFLTMETDAIEDESKYLFRMAKNRCIDYMRKKELSDKYIDFLNDTPNADTVSAYEDQSLLAKVYKEIENMKDSKYKTVLKQHYIMGKSYEEISKELKINQHVLRKNKLFGLDKLREKFGRLKI